MRQIPLTQNQFAIVDSKNYEWLSQWKWNAAWHKNTQSFYAMRYGRNKNNKQYIIYMAREILGLKKGDKRQADHRNHKTLDNQVYNLRIVTNQQNHFNQKNVKGYCWNESRGKYQAYIGVNGMQIHLGFFLTSLKAHNAYLKAKELYHKI